MHELIAKSLAKLDPLTFLAVVLGGISLGVYILSSHNSDIDAIAYDRETTTYMWMCNGLEQGTAGQHVKDMMRTKVNTVRRLEGKLGIKTPMKECQE
ncbi:MAG: hypothetical protein ACPGSM_20760 [Thiolinea sp.]